MMTISRKDIKVHCEGAHAIYGALSRQGLTQLNTSIRHSCIAMSLLRIIINAQKR